MLKVEHSAQYETILVCHEVYSEFISDSPLFHG